MEKKLTRRESRETAFLTAFAATFEPRSRPCPLRSTPPPMPLPTSYWPL